ncbi:MAG TPA: hypothetical protein VG738_17825 [Chitinophagaceae bacterium]|nr:hypothetical protein [Chitinophagaceae bacterium]
MKATALLALSFLLCTTIFAQRQPPYSYFQNHQQWYLGEAASRLPDLYKRGEYDSILAYINVTAKATNHPYVFATRLLVNIQLNRLDTALLNSEHFLDSLQMYAFFVRQSQAITPAVSDEPGSRLEDIPYDDRLFLFDAVWARLLPQSKQLDSTETFLCNVIAGKVESPVATIRANRSKYPALDSLITKRETRWRNHPGGNIAYDVGMWVPVGNASILGVHPSVGLVLGWRNKLNQVDLNLSIRLGRTPQDYVVLRSDSLYNRHFFTGGYAGLEYTRYLYHTLHFELGVKAGAGYDSFDIASNDNNNSNDYLKPFEIASLNLNAGFSMNYFFNSTGYIGLEGKFNHIHYHNKGGTPLDGNAYTITLLIGHN